MKLEEKLVQLRKEKGLSQMAVANALEVSRQAISRWEIGTAIPSTDNLRKLAELYEVNVDALLKESVVIQSEQQKVLWTECVPEAEGCTAEHVSRKSEIKIFGYAAAVLLAFGIFLAGLMLGKGYKEAVQYELIAVDEMESMDFDFSDAAIGTYGWPDFGEGGE